MLSDCCFDFLFDAETNLSELTDAVDFYSASDWNYGPEIDALRVACRKCWNDPANAEASRWLAYLADAVMRFHDAVPTTLWPPAVTAEVDAKSLQWFVPPITPPA